ncbi:cytochrome C oxidase subunit IV family protein [Calditrichota bacterium]
MNANTATDNHEHHITPLKVYFGVFAALIVFTIITVTVAQIHLGPLNLVVAMSIASVKAILVGLFFMHLKSDNKMFSVVFLLALIFLAVFIVLTMFDTMTRDSINPETSSPIRDKAAFYDSLKTSESEHSDESSVHDQDH